MGLPVDLGTVFLSLMLKDGLKDEESISNEEHLALAKLSALDSSQNEPYLLTKCREQLLPSFLAILDERLRHWVGGDVLTQTKTQTFGKGKDTKELNNAGIVSKICTLVIACYTRATSLAGHDYNQNTTINTPSSQAPTSETKKKPDTTPTFVSLSWMESNKDLETSPKPKWKKRKKERDPNLI